MPPVAYFGRARTRGRIGPRRSATTSFRGLRSYDIAQLIGADCGADTTLPPDLVQGLWEEIAPSAEEWRKLGVYGPAVPVPEDAPLQDRLLGLTGRQPS